MSYRNIVIAGGVLFVLLFLAMFGMLVNLSCTPESTDGIMGASLTNSQRITALEKKVAALELRVAALENGTTTTTIPPTTTTVKPTTTTTASTTTTTLPPSTTTTRPSTTTTAIPTTTTTQATTTTTVPGGNIIQVTSSVQAAINLAKSGDSIHIPAGTWSGGFSLNGKSGLTIYGDGVGSLVALGNASISLTNASNIVMHDFKITGNYNIDWNPAIHIGPPFNNGHFYNLTIDNISCAALYASGVQTGPYSDSITNVEFDHNTVGQSSEYGIYVGSDCAYWNVHDNTFGPDLGRQTPPHAVYIENANHITVARNTSTGITHSNGFAYKAASDTPGVTHHIYFTDNVSTGCYGGLWLVAVDYVYASGNQFKNCINDAVQLYDWNRHIFLDRNYLQTGMWGVTIIGELWGASHWSEDVHLTNNTGGNLNTQDATAAEIAAMIVENTGNSWN